MRFATFTRHAVADLRNTASVVPSSRWLARAMVEPLRARQPKVVVEFGPGTGVMTKELLRLMPKDGVLLAFEINEEFIGYLRETIPDERLQVVGAGAERAAAELRRRRIETVDGVVSSLSVGLLGDGTADTVFGRMLPFLRNDSPVTQFEYVMRLRKRGGRWERFDASLFLRRYFGSVQCARVWLNMPPAFVITCRNAKRPTAHRKRAFQPDPGLGVEKDWE